MRASITWASACLTVGLVTTAPPAEAQPTVVRRSTTIDRSRLERVLGGSADSLRLVRPTGVTTVPRAADSVRIVPGDFIFRKMSDTARQVSRRENLSVHPAPGRDDATFSVPYRWLTVDSTGVQRLLVPFFILAEGGLTYHAPSRTYRGVALVGVEDTLHPGEGTVSLPRPLKMQLTTTRGGTVSPRDLAIGHTSLAYQEVRIESPDSTQIRLRSGADPIGVTIPIPVRPITVALIPHQRSLEGFGLATTDISVSLPRGMGRSDTAVVTFSSTSSPVRPGVVHVTGSEPSTVRLRSSPADSALIRAFIDGVQAGETVVTFEPPWRFLQATLFGILLGGFARFVGAKRRKRVRSLYWDLLKGAPFGAIAAAASAIGLDLLQLKIDEPGAWIAVMLTAAVGAWLGTRVLDGLTPKTA